MIHRPPTHDTTLQVVARPSQEDLLLLNLLLRRHLLFLRVKAYERELAEWR